MRHIYDMLTLPSPGTIADIPSLWNSLWFGREATAPEALKVAPDTIDQTAKTVSKHPGYCAIDDCMSLPSTELKRVLGDALASEALGSGHKARAFALPEFPALVLRATLNRCPNAAEDAICLNEPLRIVPVRHGEAYDALFSDSAIGLPRAVVSENESISGQFVEYVDMPRHPASLELQILNRCGGDSLESIYGPLLKSLYNIYREDGTRRTSIGVELLGLLYVTALRKIDCLPQSAFNGAIDSLRKIFSAPNTTMTLHHGGNVLIDLLQLQINFVDVDLIGRGNRRFPELFTLLLFGRMLLTDDDLRPWQRMSAATMDDARPMMQSTFIKVNQAMLLHNVQWCASEENYEGFTTMLKDCGLTSKGA